MVSVVPRGLYLYSEKNTIWRKQILILKVNARGVKRLIALPAEEYVRDCGKKIKSRDKRFANRDNMSINELPIKNLLIV